MMSLLEHALTSVVESNDLVPTLAAMILVIIIVDAYLNRKER
jgi:hypothetical protein